MDKKDVTRIKHKNLTKNRWGKMIFVDYPFLFSGTVNYLRKIVKNKKYGKILYQEILTKEQKKARKKGKAKE